MGERTGGGEGGETVVSIYYVSKNSVFNKGKKCVLQCKVFAVHLKCSIYIQLNFMQL